MSGDDWGRGGQTDARMKELNEKPASLVSVTKRWSFGVKGFKSISIFGWLKKVRELWNNER